jgi:hypothetical protein
MTAATPLGFALAVAWLRWRVAGAGRDRGGAAVAAVLAAVLALNVTWLFGFTSFSLGAALFPVTLGVWWSGRDGGFSGRRAGALAGLTALGYFCHAVSLGLSAFGLAVLEVFTPGRDRRGRAATTALGLLPLVPLGAIYLGLMRRGGGGLAPEWKHLADPFSPRAWAAQLTWADPISLARKDVVPLVGGYAATWCGVFAPVVWLAAGLALALAAGRWGGVGRERRGWWVLAAVLVLGGAASPDTLGATHGEYLPQRVVLLGLVALVPVLRLDLGTALGRASAVALAGALVLQTATVWDYARTSERTAGRLLRAGPAVGSRQRVATLLAGIRTRFRANPLLHADCALGVGTGNVIWADYETRFYYFPVRFRDAGGPDPREFELIALMDAPRLSAARADRWARLLERHRDAIDAVLVWGSDPLLDAVNARNGFSAVYADGPVRVLRRD